MQGPAPGRLEERQPERPSRTVEDHGVDDGCSAHDPSDFCFVRGHRRRRDEYSAIKLMISPMIVRMRLRSRLKVKLPEPENIGDYHFGE